jgi:hypothetical protein
VVELPMLSWPSATPRCASRVSVPYIDNLRPNGKIKSRRSIGGSIKQTGSTKRFLNENILLILLMEVTQG